MSYRASTTVACTKQHTCVGCNKTFNYLLSRKVTAEGKDEATAAQNMWKIAEAKMASDVEFAPCPYCGVVQPEMIADVRSGRYLIGGSLGVVVVVASLILGLTEVMRVESLSWVAAGGAAFALVCFLWGSRFHPNRSLDRNLSEQGGDEFQREQQARLSDKVGVSGMFGLILALGAVVVAAGPTLLRRANDWPINNSTYPEVAGLGDVARFYFDSSITSVQGMWNGQVTAIAEGPDVNTGLMGKTKTSSWGQTISGKSVTNSTNRMWADITLPGDVKLLGKTLKLNMKSQVQYPFREGAGFVVLPGEFTLQASVTLAPAGAGATYWQAFWGGHVLSSGLLIVASAMLVTGARSLRRSGNPTQLFPVEQTGGTPPPLPAE